jgi:hypothetical protein
MTDSVQMKYKSDLNVHPEMFIPFAPKSTIAVTGAMPSMWHEVNDVSLSAMLMVRTRDVNMQDDAGSEFSVKRHELKVRSARAVIGELFIPVNTQDVKVAEVVIVCGVVNVVEPYDALISKTGSPRKE